MRKKISLLLTTLLIPLTSAYIDPGTGGYLITTTWTAIIGILTTLFFVVGTFFRRYLIEPVKKHKKMITLVAIVILMALVIYKYEPKEEYVFDASLSGAHFYNPEKIADGYVLIEGKLIDKTGKIINQWNSTHLGLILPNGDYLAQESYEAGKWGKYTWNDTVIWERVGNPIHHEISISEKGTILTITKEVHMYKDRDVEFDVVVEFDQKGNSSGRRLAPTAPARRYRVATASRGSGPSGYG